MKPFTIAIRHLPPLLAAILLSQCSAPVSVKTVKPVATAYEAPIPTPGCLLASIRDATQRISRGDDSALAFYNHSVARLIESLEKTGVDPWSATVNPTDSCGTFSVKGRAPADVNPLAEHLIPADTLEFRGDSASQRATVSGIGAPVVAVTTFDGIGHKEVRRKLPVRNLTAMVRFEGQTATLELIDPYQVETIQFAGRSRKLSADYSAAIMLALSKARIDKLGFARLIRPSRYNDTARLSFLQPYDPKRIPVLMVHGLDSTPATFAKLYFKLLEDPQIRENYQFWVFSYPSGYPYHYSASLLRRELDVVRSEFPGHPDMVIIGHSMGGMISRLMVTDAGDSLWLKAFGKPPSNTPMVGYSRKLLEEILIFDNRSEIDRAIFFSAPHRGSELASNWVGGIFSRLIRVPALIADVRNVALSVATADQAGLLIQTAPNSIGTLSPRNPYVVAVSRIPIAPGVPYHSVIGDRGKGDTPDSSDGVVPYWSSHLEGAVSEKIVPSGHGSHECPEGIEEARRILDLHLEGK